MKLRSGNKCYFLNCGKTRREKEKLHMFKIPNDGRTQQWILNSGNLTLLTLPPESLRKIRICEYHFSKKDFTKKNRLKKTAVPLSYLDYPVVPTSKPQSEANPRVNLCGHACSVPCSENISLPEQVHQIHEGCPRFPKAKYKEWFDCLGIDSNLPWPENGKICSIHFMEDSFVHTGFRVRLKPNSKPKLYLPVSPKFNDIGSFSTVTLSSKKLLVSDSGSGSGSDFKISSKSHKDLRKILLLDLRSQPSTSGTQNFSESEPPHVNLSQMVVKPETETSMVKIEPKLEDQEFDDTTASTMDYREFASAGDHTTSTQTASASAICRLCLRVADKERVISLSTMVADRTEKCVRMIKLLMPNFDFSLVHDPLMCHLCTMRLELACKFVEETMESQETIKAYRDQYAVNDQVYCEDVIKYKSSPSDLGPPNKKMKLHSPQMESSLNYDGPEDDAEGYFDTAEEQPLDIKEVELKIDDEMFCAESDNFIKLETVLSKNTDDNNERLTAINSEFNEGDLDEPNPSNLKSNKHLDNFIKFETVLSKNMDDSNERLTAIKSEPYEGDLDRPNTYNLESNKHSETDWNLQISDLISRTSNKNLE